MDDLMRLSFQLGLLSFSREHSMGLGGSSSGSPFRRGQQQHQRLLAELNLR